MKSPEITADEIVGACFGPGINSHDRAEKLLYAIAFVWSWQFWPVFLQVYNSCDCTWPWRPHFLSLLRDYHEHSRARDYMDVETAAFYDALPPVVTIYRGCSRYRVRGLSWTTDREIAAKFARGIRFDGEPDRVLATARIPKEFIFAAFVDRKESELTIDPRRLRSLSVEPFETWPTETH